MATPAVAPRQFVPRPFPPPSLSHVPVEYIVDQLRNLALHYWNKPETADCTIVIPVPHPRRVAGNKTSSLFPPASYSSPIHDPSGMGRRATEPAITANTMPRIILKVHLDYLIAQSELLRGVFSGASPLDLLSSTNTATSSSPTVPPNITAPRLPVPANRLPRLLPSSSEHPILYLPVPDPSSITLLFHWVYFGKSESIRGALDNGTVQWEGIARNVEYLGLSTEIKIFLGKYYRAWLHPERGRFDKHLDGDSDNEDDDLEDVDSDADSDDTAYDTCLSDLGEDEDRTTAKGFGDLNFNDPFDGAESSTAASATASVVDDVGCVDDLDDELWTRGRSRQTRCLSASYIPTDPPPLYLGENKRWSA